MIIYGTRRVPKTEEFSSPIQCPHCLQTAPLLVVGCVEYFYLYGIPFFGWKKVVYICSKCQKTLSEFSQYDEDLNVVMPSEAKEISQQVKNQVRVPWYYFSGLILIAGFIIFAYLSSM